MLTRQQVNHEVRQIHNNQLSVSESKVAQSWKELACEWLGNESGDYWLDGFRGFMDRSVDSITLDLHFAGELIDPLSDEEEKTYLDRDHEWKE